MIPGRTFGARSILALYPRLLSLNARARTRTRCSTLNLHIADKDFVVWLAFPDDILRQAVNFIQRIERGEGNILHENFSGLLQRCQALLAIGGFLLFLDELVEFRIAVTGSLANAGVEVLVVERIGIDGRPAGVVKGGLAAVDSFFTPV